MQRSRPQKFSFGSASFILYRQATVQKVFIRNRESNQDRIRLDDAGQIFGCRVYIVSFRNQSFADVTGNWCFDFGIVHIDFGQFEISLGLSYGGLGLQNIEENPKT